MNEETAQRLCGSLEQMTSAVCALIEAMGMHAENEGRKTRGEAMAYDHDSFLSIINKHYLQGF